MMNRNLSKTSCSNSIRSFDNLSGASGSYSRRDFIKAGACIASILAAGKAPSAIVRSMCGLKNLMIAGGGGLSAKSYIQDGLIAMWDGIENAGWGQHDASATTWKDLAGGMGDFTGVQSGKWTDNGIDFDGYTLHMSKHPDSFISITMEFVVDSFSRVTTNGSNSGAFVGCPSQSADGSNLSIGYWGHLNTSSAYSNVNRLDSGAIPKNTISGVFTSSGKSIYNDGIFMLSNTFGISLPQSRFPLSIMGYYNGNATSLVFIGKAVVHSFRIYSRALTAAEIDANYAVDKARFNLP